MIFVGSTFDHSLLVANKAYLALDLQFRDIGDVSVKIESDIIFPPTPCPESLRGVVRGGFNRDRTLNVDFVSGGACDRNLQ